MSTIQALCPLVVVMAMEGFLFPHEILRLQLVCKDFYVALDDASEEVWRRIVEKYGGAIKGNWAALFYSPLSDVLLAPKAKILRPNASFDMNPWLEEASVNTDDRRSYRNQFKLVYNSRCMTFQPPLVSAYDHNYVCQIKHLVFKKNGIEIWFRVNGDFSLGPLQDPSHSGLWINGARNVPSKMWYTCAQPRECFEGILEYDCALTIEMSISFEYGHTGYQKTALLDLSRAVCRGKHLENLLNIGTVLLTTPVVSVYNVAYYCTVKTITFVSGNELHLNFRVVGNSSLGELQNPRNAILRVNGKVIPVYSHAITRKVTGQQQELAGTLIFKETFREGMELEFSYGSGYTNAPLCSLTSPFLFDNMLEYIIPRN